MTLEQRHTKSLLIHAQRYQDLEAIFGAGCDEEKACLAYVEENEPETGNESAVAAYYWLGDAQEKLNSLVTQEVQ